MFMDLVVEDGTVVTPGGIAKTDIAIDGEKIAALGSKGVFPKTKRVISAKGKVVIPGGIDPPYYRADSSSTRKSVINIWPLQWVIMNGSLLSLATICAVVPAPQLMMISPGFGGSALGKRIGEIGSGLPRVSTKFSMPIPAISEACPK